MNRSNRQPSDVARSAGVHAPSPSSEDTDILPAIAGKSHTKAPATAGNAKALWAIAVAQTRPRRRRGGIGRGPVLFLSGLLLVVALAVVLMFLLLQ